MMTRLLTVPLALLLVQGCGDALTEVPEDFLTPDEFYRTAEDASAAVLSAYEPMTAGTDALRGRGGVGLEVVSDQSIAGASDPGPTHHAAARLAMDPGNRTVTDIWGPLYQAIARANLAIERIPGVRMREDHRAALIGEAKFLRALHYFYLVRLYGSVPLVTTADAPRSQNPAATVDELYGQIVRDAQEAARTLPLRWDDGNAGRATRGAALTLLADAHLARREWQSAADYARQVIDLGVYRLYPDYLHAFLPEYENGAEHVFSFQADGPNAPNGSAFVAQYFPRALGNGRGGGWGTIQPTEWHLDSYLPGDYRREVTYRTDWVDVQGKEYRNLSPHVFKFRPSVVTADRAGDVNWPIYRYAEVLLIHAEALNELGRTGEAVRYLNRIRARARNADGEPRAQPADYDGPMSQAAVREAILMERSWELAHEGGKRWFDLIRQGRSYFMSQLSAHDPQATDLQPTDMLWPIPQDEIDLNPGLRQNPGY